MNAAKWNQVWKATPCSDVIAYVPPLPVYAGGGLSGSRKSVEHFYFATLCLWVLNKASGNHVRSISLSTFCILAHALVLILLRNIIWALKWSSARNTRAAQVIPGGINSPQLRNSSWEAIFVPSLLRAVFRKICSRVAKNRPVLTGSNRLVQEACKPNSYSPQLTTTIGTRKSVIKQGIMSPYKIL